LKHPFALDRKGHFFNAQPSVGTGNMEFKGYVFLHRWWWFILATTMVAAIFGYLSVRQQLPQYQSTITLAVGPAGVDPIISSSQLSQQLAQAYAGLAGRHPVRQMTMDSLGLTWPPLYTARAIPNTQLVEITVVDSDPERAQTVANELARQLIRHRPTPSEPEKQHSEELTNTLFVMVEASAPRLLNGSDIWQAVLLAAAIGFILATGAACCWTTWARR
jgi:capsular polysaccharide biosynthesis protein